METEQSLMNAGGEPRGTAYRTATYESISASAAAINSSTMELSITSSASEVSCESSASEIRLSMSA